MLCSVHPCIIWNITDHFRKIKNGKVQLKPHLLTRTNSSIYDHIIISSSSWSLLLSSVQERGTEKRGELVPHAAVPGWAWQMQHCVQLPFPSSAASSGFSPVAAPFLPLRPTPPPGPHHSVHFPSPPTNNFLP